MREVATPPQVLCESFKRSTVCVCARICRDTSVHIFTCMPTCVDTSLYVYIQLSIHAYMHACMHACMHTYILTHTHTRTDKDTHAHVCDTHIHILFMYINIQIYICVYTYLDAYIHTCIHAVFIHACIHARKHACVQNMTLHLHHSSECTRLCLCVVDTPARRLHAGRKVMPGGLG